jgi:hypothetical protein
MLSHKSGLSHILRQSDYEGSSNLEHWQCALPCLCGVPHQPRSMCPYLSATCVPPAVVCPTNCHVCVVCPISCGVSHQLYLSATCAQLHLWELPVRVQCCSPWVLLLCVPPAVFCMSMLVSRVCPTAFMTASGESALSCSPWVF